MGMKPRPKPRMVTCETPAAILIHLRELEPDEEPCYSGRKNKNAKTLCNMVVGWDCKFPLSEATCNTCIAANNNWRQG